MAKSSAKGASQKNKSNGASTASGKASSSGGGSRSQRGAGGPTLVAYLGRAAGKERHIEAALAAHLVMTTRPTYHGRLESHLRDTKARAEKLERRMKSLGGSPRSISAPGSAVMSEVKDAAKMVADRAMSLARGPLDAMRDDHEASTLLENARVEYADASEQIATYAVVRALAKAEGDKDTGKLAKDFGAEHADMADFLEKLIPKLSSAVVKTEARTESKGAAGSSGGRSSSGSSKSSRSNGSSGRASSGGSSGARSSASKSSSAGAGSGGSRSRSGSKAGKSTGGSGGAGSRSRAGTSSGGSRSSGSSGSGTGKSTGGSRSSAASSSGSRSRSSAQGGSSGGRQKASGGRQKTKAKASSGS